MKQRNTTSKKIKAAKRNFERQLAKECKKNPKSLFKYANFKSKTKHNNIRLKDQDGNIKTNDKDNANILSKFFESVFNEEEDAKELIFNDASEILGEESPDPFFYNTKPLKSMLSDLIITQSMISEQLKEIDPYKANIRDCVSPRIIKEMGDHLLEPLEIIYNLSIKHGTVPSLWKKATVTALHKGEDKHNAQNYRPVSITSVLCRIMERILKKYIVQHIEENELLASEQHGFVRNRSCLSNLLLNIEYLTSCYDNGIAVDQIFLDLQKAFDTVPHQRLLFKIKKMGINGKIYAWIESFLMDRYQRVAVNQENSNWCKVKSGVPQGSVLGPILFILFVNDLPEVIEALCSIFADDTKVADEVSNIEDAERLQEDLKKLQEWTHTWKLKFNASKCKVMHFGKNNHHFNYTMDGQPLKKVEEEKDLGAIISFDLKVQSNIKHQIAKANQMLGLIRRTFSYLNKESFLALYKAYVRPHLEYCQQALHPYLAKDIQSLEKVQQRATKLVQSIQHLSYEERLAELNLYSLSQRRERGDMITVYKILNGMMDIPADKLFKLADKTPTRGHSMKLKVPRTCKTDIRRDAFSQRTISPWNKLPEHIIKCETVKEFKREYDKHMLNTQ